MELDKEFIQQLEVETQKIVEKILEEKQVKIAEITLQEIRNKWNEERIQKTESILNGYKKLNDFVNTINFTDREFKSMERQQIKTIMKNNFTDNETFLERLYNSKINTEAFVSFLSKIFNDYIDEKTDSSVVSDIRKAQLLKEMYMEGTKPSEVKVGYSSPKTFYKDRDELLDELAPKILGIYGIKFSEKSYSTYSL